MYGQFIRPTDRTPGSDSSFVTSWITSPRVGVTGSIAEVIILLFSYMDKRSLSISSRICQLLIKYSALSPPQWRRIKRSLPPRSYM